MSAVIVGIPTIAELEEDVRIARNFSPLDAKEMKRLEDLTKEYYAEVSFFKTDR